MTDDEKLLSELIHDMRSKCSTLIDGVEALRGAPAERRRKLMSLMKPQARKVVELLAAYEAKVERP